MNNFTIEIRSYKLYNGQIYKMIKDKDDAIPNIILRVLLK